MTKLSVILNAGWDIHISCVAKRMSLTGSDDDRDWHARYIWEAVKDHTRKECEWEGFSTPEECLKDMFEKLKPKPKKNSKGKK